MGLYLLIPSVQSQLRSISNTSIQQWPTYRCSHTVCVEYGTYICAWIRQTRRFTLGKLQSIVGTGLQTAAARLLFDGEVEPERSSRRDGELDRRRWQLGETGRPRGEEGERDLPLLAEDGDTPAATTPSPADDDIVHEVSSAESLHGREAAAEGGDRRSGRPPGEAAGVHSRRGLNRWGGGKGISSPSS